MSVDGKITSGADDVLDPDQDWMRIAGVREGLHQFYEIEKTTDLYNLNTGRVMAKIGVNSRTEIPEKTPVTFFIVDRKPHLQLSGLKYLAQRANKLYVVTNNKSHPAFAVKETSANVKVIFYPEDVDLSDLLYRLRTEYGIEHLTIQSGGTFNTALLRLGLIDRLTIIVAPLLVGGKDTSGIFDGEAILSQSQLTELKALKLISCEVLENSYIRLDYDVIAPTVITK
jgi:2,5-diamino-6-(ribosylamino)-4(3H)-pyrimidinone 5'-phosphate reductase